MQKFNSKKLIRVGFIGLGDHAMEQLFPSLITIPSVELTIISSRNPDKLELFANKFKPKFTTENWEEVIDPNLVDAIIVSASPGLHYQVTKKCLEKRIHVFVEKPPTQNLSQLQELIELQKKTNCKTFVGYNFTHSAAFGKMQQVLGPNIKFFRSKFISSRPKSFNYHYQSVLEYGLFSMLIHPLDTLIQTLGKVKKHNFQLTWIDSVNFTMINFFQCQKGNGVIEWGNYSNRFECDFELVNEQNEVGRCQNLWNLEFFNLQETKLTNNFKNKETLNYHFSPLTGGFERTGYTWELANFFEAIEQNQPSKSELEQSLEIYRVLEEIQANLA